MGPEDFLPWVYSQGNRAQRYLSDLVSDPLGNLRQGLGNLNDQAGTALSTLMQTGAPVGQPVTSQMQQARNTLVDQMGPAMMGATVWHGSPHMFDKFDASKIGTGEGAQAYGHGIYAAESPAVAKQYAGDLSAAKATKPVGNVDLTQAYQNLAGDVPDSLLAARRDFRSLNDIGALSPADRRDFLEAVKNNIVGAKGGSLYKVDLPDEHIAKMLDWDKPLSQQSPEVQQMLPNLNPWQQQMMDEPRMHAGWKDAFGPANTGAVQYGKLMQEKGGPEGAAAYLQSLGIPGIKYLDGGSRGAGAGTSNYVVFPGNENLLQILERNGKPLKSLLKK